MRTFKNAFTGYNPVEEGDFFLLFKIRGKSFILHRNETKILCLSLYDFKYKSYDELAILLSLNPSQAAATEEEKEEFFFEKESTEEEILAFLFDIEEIIEGKALKYVENQNGYLLYSLDGKAVNILNEDGSLSFDNTFCYAMRKCTGKKKTGVFVTFTCQSFEKAMLNSSVLTDNDLYLLPGINPLILSQITDLNIPLFVYMPNVGKNIHLLMLIYYLLQENSTFGFRPYFDGAITLFFDNTIDTTDILELVVRAEKELRHDYEILSQEDLGRFNSFYSMTKLKNEETLVMFQNSEVLIESICKSLIIQCQLNLKLVH